MAPGRARGNAAVASMTDAAVARAIGYVELHGDAIPEDMRHRDEAVETLIVWTKNGEREFCSACGTLPDFLHDDDLARRVLVPWLRGQGWDVSVEFYAWEGKEVVDVFLKTSRARYGAQAVGVSGRESLAHACCQVVLAISQEGESR